MPATSHLIQPLKTIVSRWTSILKYCRMKGSIVWITTQVPHFSIYGYRPPSYRGPLHKHYSIFLARNLLSSPPVEMASSSAISVINLLAIPFWSVAMPVSAFQDLGLLHMPSHRSFPQSRKSRLHHSSANNG